MTTYIEKCSRNITGHPVGALEILTCVFAQWMKTQQLRASLSQERRQLREMPEALLKDIGVSKTDADLEAQRNDIPPARLG